MYKSKYFHSLIIIINAYHILACMLSEASI